LKKKFTLREKEHFLYKYYSSLDGGCGENDNKRLALIGLEHSRLVSYWSVFIPGVPSKYWPRQDASRYTIYCWMAGSASDFDHQLPEHKEHFEEGVDLTMGSFFAG
jgi:hypothetical protein